MAAFDFSINILEVMPLVSIIYNSPLGPLYVAEEDGYIVEVSFMEAETREKLRRDEGSVCGNTANAKIITACVEELKAYFAGTLKDFTVPIRLKGTDFRMRVWDKLRSIPYGEVISYKELAKRIGQPTAIRAAGGANHDNPISIIVPCHRVVGAKGDLVGYGGGLGNKEFLLNLEKKQ
ncbi:MAG: methylated-DNA--[protein]-cysteine S-methyltransferase [Defluviitaleaceae bacterium]|nr:methylated-DNA--[protein]-cysteine S-methyltransferase [Defluviitaleaceae bacterium]